MNSARRAALLVELKRDDETMRASARRHWEESAADRPPMRLSEPAATTPTGGRVMAVRECSWPESVTATKEPYVADLDCPVRQTQGFVPPSQPQGRVEHVGSSGSTLTRTVYDSGLFESARFDDAEAHAVQAEATASIVKPKHLIRGTNFDR